ncbi:MAG: hypothetical protein ACOCZ5_00050 [bacterium]
MSFKDFLDLNSLDEKINTFKEDMLYNKDFSNSFLELTSIMDEETQSKLFEDIIDNIINISRNNLKKYKGE